MRKMKDINNVVAEHPYCSYCGNAMILVTRKKLLPNFDKKTGKPPIEETYFVLECSNKDGDRYSWWKQFCISRYEHLWHDMEKL